MPEGRHSERHCIDPHVAGAGVETKSRQVKPLAHSWHELIQIAAVPSWCVLTFGITAPRPGRIGT